MNKTASERFGWRACWALALVLSLTGVPLKAQIGGSGSIRGVLTDESGAVVPGATVIARNTGTGVETSRRTTEAGLYSLAPLPAGKYEVMVSADGFQKLTQQNVTVDALAEVGLNLRLQVGRSNQEVTVSAIAPQLNTSDASMGQTVRNETYSALPLAMGNAPRDPTAFTNLMPGMSTSSQTGNTAGNALGSQDHSGEVYIEGLAATNPVVQGETRTLGLGVSVEAVDQFQMETAGTSAQLGGQGSTNFVVKSGTNQFHGSVYEYFRNTVLDARGFFSLRRPAEHQNEFGFTFGGPIVKNRLFFFTNYDGFRYTQQTQGSLASIPTLDQRKGNFSALPVAIFDPATTSCPAGGVCTRTPFPGNIIPSDRISSISQNLQSFLPPTANSSLQNNFLTSNPIGYNNDSTTNKIDFSADEKDTFNFLLSHGHRSQSSPYRGDSLPLPYANTRLVDEIPWTAQAKWTRVLTPTIVNQLSYGFSRLNVPIINATIDGDYATKAGLGPLPAGEAASAFPEISFAGPNAPGNWRGTDSRAFIDVSNTFTLQDNVQWTRGKHSLTLGAQMQWLQVNEKQRAYGSLASWAFSNVQTAGFSPTGAVQASTGNPYASFLLGTLNQANIIQDSAIATGGRFKNFAWWIQDTYKVTPRLTVNIGLRHDIWTPYKEVVNRQSYFDPNLPNPAANGYPGALGFYGNVQNGCNCSSTIDTYLRNFGPRIGIAFSLNDKTVIRAGYSIMYTHRGAVGGRGGGRYGTDMVGYSANAVINGPNDGFSPAFDWDNGVPAYQQPPVFDPSYGTGYNGTGNVPAGLTYGDPKIGGRPPRYQNWNFAIERSILSDLTLGAAYIGSNGHFLGGGGRGIWSDQIDPRFLALGSLLQQTVTPAVIARANAIIPGIRLPYASFSGGSLSQMLRPWPQYSNVTDVWGDVGNSNYNSLQVYANKRLSHGLAFNFNYTLAKAFDDTASNVIAAQSFGTGTAYNWGNMKAVSQLPRHTLNLLTTYELPFGAGRPFANSGGVVSRIVGNWQVSGIVTYRSGMPIGTIGAACNLPNAGSCFASYANGFNGDVRINGNWGDGNLTGANTTAFLDKAAFVSPASFTYGNTPRTSVYGIENPGTRNLDVNVRRDFAIREQVKLTMQLDAFNVFNLVNFSAPSTNITSANFGKITGQSNTPRVFQISARIRF